MKKSILALLLLVPAPTVGVLVGMYWFPNSKLGSTIFIASKIWLFLFPVVWLKLVDKKKFSLSRPRKGGFLVGLITGLAITGFILLLYNTVGTTLIDKEFLIEKMTEIGLNSLPVYIGGSLYWILVNSVLEEYVWRWFCVEKAENVMHSVGAILFAAFFFTFHHIFAMHLYFSNLVVVVGSVGIFIGAALWSFMYIKYRSIWPGYLSHAIVDLCVFGIGAAIIFG
ncbi:MAG: CPBP family intramembrane metalloprotease [Kiritimatiellae bacterium]|nr:CPBP family intramembrane metalloprotease [Kiritimatiellia bacterium]